MTSDNLLTLDVCSTGSAQASCWEFNPPWAPGSCSLWPVHQGLSCCPVGHSKWKENEKQALGQGGDSRGWIFSISVSPGGSGMVHLFHMDGFTLMLSACKGLSLHHTLPYDEHLNRPHLALTSDLDG